MLKYGAYVGLEAFDGRVASVMVVVEQSVSGTCSCKSSDLKMGVGSRPGESEKDDGIRRGRSARIRGRMVWVSELRT
jgi:hypothetical protein